MTRVRLVQIRNAIGLVGHNVAIRTSKHYM